MPAISTKVLPTETPLLSRLQLPVLRDDGVQPHSKAADLFEQLIALRPGWEVADGLK
jgi:hypothetical protein